MQKRKILVSWLFVFAWMSVIFIFSQMPANESGNTSSSFTASIVKPFTNNLPIEKQNEIVEKMNFPIRKLAHFTEFLILGILVLIASKKSFKKNRFILYAILICVLYACSDEIHQIFITGRACRLLDVIIDSSGSLLGVFGTKHLLILK